MSADIVKWSGAAFCLAPPIGGLLVIDFRRQLATGNTADDAPLVNIDFSLSTTLV